MPDKKVKLPPRQRAILRTLYYGDRELSTNQIARDVGINPVTAKKELLSLRRKGFILVRKGKIKRDFTRYNKATMKETRVKSETIILWRLNT